MHHDISPMYDNANTNYSFIYHRIIVEDIHTNLYHSAENEILRQRQLLKDSMRVLKQTRTRKPHIME